MPWLPPVLLALFVPGTLPGGLTAEDVVAFGSMVGDVGAGLFVLGCICCWLALPVWADAIVRVPTSAKAAVPSVKLVFRM